MKYTKNLINNTKSIKRDEKNNENCEASRNSFFSHSLTTYKKVVDINYYGLTLYDYNEVKIKHQNQKDFLNKNFIYDKMTRNKIPLSDITISANHNPNRYHAQIQNRINTLVQTAEDKKLKPLFITLTLPSEFHKMKYNKTTNKLIPNPKYNGTTPKEAIKILTKMYSKLRQDRSLKELNKNQRIYYRVNEPHKDGTPHTHVLLYIPENRINRTITAFKRLFNTKTNKIEHDIQSAKSYIMKYINKTLPLSKQEDLSVQDKYLNAWYSKNRIIRFNSSQTLAPLNLYKLLYSKFSLNALTKIVKNNSLKIFVSIKNPNKIMEVFHLDELIYIRNENFELRQKVL